MKKIMTPIFIAFEMFFGVEGNDFSRGPIPIAEFDLPSIYDVAFDGVVINTDSISMRCFLQIPVIPHILPTSYTHAHVKKLSYSKRSLHEIPIEILAHPYLKKLDLSNNLIEQIPIWMNQLTTLEVLNLSQNSLAHVDVDTLPANLVRISLSHNTNISIDLLRLLKNASNLQTICLKFAKIEDLATLGIDENSQPATSREQKIELKLRGNPIINNCATIEQLTALVGEACDIIRH